MRKHSGFTQEEIRILKENPNTAKLTESRISLTLDAKQTSSGPCAQQQPGD